MYRDREGSGEMPAICGIKTGNFYRATSVKLDGNQSKRYIGCIAHAQKDVSLDFPYYRM